MPDSGSSAGPSPKPRAEILAFAREALQREAEAIQGLIPRLGEEFVEAVQRIAETRGRVILSGLGKSGLVAKKVAATMASLGIPAFFLHAAEAFHGDMGVLQEGDLLIVFSKSGETKEVLELVQLVRTRDVPVLAITGNRHSTLARYSDLVLHAAVEREADHLNLAPTASAVAQLALGDALAVTVAWLRGFTESDFAILHPAGALGRKLLLTVDQLMHTGEENPVVHQDADFAEAIYTVTRKGLGCVSVVDDEGRLVGIITDGDIRRLLERSKENTVQALFQRKVRDIMTKTPKFVQPETLATKALQKMEDHKITVLPVVDPAGRPIGMIHIHDLVSAGIERAREVYRKRWSEG